MHIHFFLGLAFLEENLTIVDEVKKRYGDKAKFSALVAARSHVMDMLDKKKGTPQEFYRYDWLSALEQKWLDTPLDREKLAKYEEMLGTDTLRRIITADRELGVGLVTCGTVENTKLIELTKDNDEARWAYVVGLLDYCFDFYENEKPDMVFMYCIAGAVALAMAEVAIYLKIPFVQPIFSRIGDYQVLDTTTNAMLPKIKNLYLKSLKDPKLIEGTQKEAEDYISSFLKKPDAPADTKAWVKILLNNHSFLGMFKTLAIDLARWVAIILGLQGTKGVLRQRKGLSIAKHNLRKFFYIQYELRFKKQKPLDEIIGDAPFLYFPLHVSPEASTMVLADKIANQFAVIERISKSMPAGYKLLVKEHITCVGRRPKGYYDRIQALPDVHMVSPFANNFELQQRTKLLITLTGSSAWESMMMGYPVLILGNLHFTNIGEGFKTCDDFTKLEQTIKKAIQTKPASKEKVKTYAACLMKEGFKLSQASIWYGQKYDKKDLKNNISIMVDKMEDTVKSRQNKKEKSA